MQIEKLEKAISETIQKLTKLTPTSTLGAELAWCWESYQNDNNPEGVIEKSQVALEVLKAEKVKNSRSVSAKLIENLEKGLN